MLASEELKSVMTTTVMLITCFRCLLAVLGILVVFPAHSTPENEGIFFIDTRLVKIEELKEKDLYQYLAPDWSRFDKYAKDSLDMFEREVHPNYWYLQLSPPFPTNWPPQKTRSVTYYAYAEYQELYRHGPVLSRSAPWSSVVLTEGTSADKVILAGAIGPVIHNEASVPISSEMAARLIQIKKSGQENLSDFIGWKTIPDNKKEVIAVREYYCQWALTNHTAELIKDRHGAFFEWLNCPPPTRFPVR